MKEVIFKIIENRHLNEKVMRIRMQGDCSAIVRAGQFVDLQVEGQFLRRPFSVCDVQGDVLTVCYRINGRGTEALSLIPEGRDISVLTGLGNGYDLSLSGEKPVLIGGGMGYPPMYITAKQLIERGVKPTVILGFNTVSELLYEEEFKALGCDVLVTTVDGTYGMKGFVTDALDTIDYTYFYTCGPEPMFKAVYDRSKTSGEFSFEARMGCGFGACMGCSCETLVGTKRICKDGPVMKKEELKW